MLAVAAAGADIGDLWEWSAWGYYPVDPTNEAYRFGISLLVYAFTHRGGSAPRGPPVPTGGDGAAGSP